MIVFNSRHQEKQRLKKKPLSHSWHLKKRGAPIETNRKNMQASGKKALVDARPYTVIVGCVFSPPAILTEGNHRNTIWTEQTTDSGGNHRRKKT